MPSKTGQQIIDTDVHNAFRHREDLLPFLPAEWHKQWCATGVGIGSLYYSPVGVIRRDATPDSGAPPASDVAFLESDHLDRYGIDYAILTGSDALAIGVHPDPDYANALATAFNDWMIAAWLDKSSRFRGSIFVNVTDPPAAAAEIDRIGGHPGMVQVIMSSGTRLPYGQRFYHPIYAAAARNQLPVAIHPGTEGRGTAGPTTPVGHPTRYFEWHNILAVGFMAHINSLICEGVFEKFPELTFIAIEGGIAWLPHLMWRMDKNYKALRSSVPWLRSRPSEQMQRHIKLTTQPIEEPDNPRHLSQIIDMAGAEDMIMFSTDYPHWDFDNPSVALPPLTKETRHKIMAGTAATVYGIDLTRASES